MPFETERFRTYTVRMKIGKVSNVKSFVDVDCIKCRLLSVSFAAVLNYVAREFLDEYSVRDAFIDGISHTATIYVARGFGDVTPIEIEVRVLGNDAEHYIEVSVTAPITESISVENVADCIVEEIAGMLMNRASLEE